jgi:hypothetical protein
MKKWIFFLVLAAVMICGIIITGCSTQTEKEGSESSFQLSQYEELESSSESEGSSSENSSSGRDTTIMVVPPSSSVPEQEEITGALVMYSESIFGSATEVLGTDADLNAWNKAISGRDPIAKVLVSTWNMERDLTENEISTVLDTLENLSPAVMNELGNPATGGATNVAAFDRNGNRLWSVTLNSNWLIVQVSGDNSRRILEINEADTAPIQNIAA